MIGLEEIESGRRALEEPAKERKLLARPFGHGDVADRNACRASELL